MYPLTMQWSAWYAGISLTGILFMAALAFYGFYTSLGGGLFSAVPARRVSGPPCTRPSAVRRQAGPVTQLLRCARPILPDRSGRRKWRTSVLGSANRKLGGG